jgi:hypothetical protein
MPTQLNPASIEKALSITGHFEDSDDPFGAVSGNFDGMGISLGVLQWNIGSGSLQPLLKELSTDEIRTPCRLAERTSSGRAACLRPRDSKS